MAHPYHHAVSSARQFGGSPEDYQAIHDWFDATKEFMADWRHRALRHHAQGIFECERVFGTIITVRLPSKSWMFPPTKRVPVRLIGEQHVREDLGRIPTVQDWLKHLRAGPGDEWMTRGVAKMDADRREKR